MNCTEFVARETIKRNPERYKKGLSLNKIKEYCRDNQEYIDIIDIIDAKMIGTKKIKKELDIVAEDHRWHKRDIPNEIYRILNDN